MEADEEEVEIKVVKRDDTRAKLVLHVQLGVRPRARTWGKIVF